MVRSAQRSGNLPAEAASFVGRRYEIAEARRTLTAARLVTLVGAGGVGKTRLAVRIATDLGRAFPGGVWLVELADLRDPALVGNAVLAALDLRDQAEREPVTLLRSYLRDKDLLLVLDNCEHLLDATARLIDDVLRAAPGVRVLATSREPLSVAGEHVLPVPPLDLPSPQPESLAQTSRNDAVRLFVERAAAAAGRFELTDANRAAVVDVCRRLDGLPLAIELAAVRTRALSPDQIRDRLSDRFNLLTGGNRAALPRHQTLRTAIEWSYDLLTPAEQTMLTRLCVFAGRYTLDDIEGVCSADDLPAAHALDLVTSLLDKSLLSKEDAGVACYRLHETMREFARLKLREGGDADTVELRCADYYLSRCQQFAATGRYRLLPSLTLAGPGDRQHPGRPANLHRPWRLPARGRHGDVAHLVLDHPCDHRGCALARRAAGRTGCRRLDVLRARLPGRPAERSGHGDARARSGCERGPRGRTTRRAVANPCHGLDRGDHAGRPRVRATTPRRSPDHRRRAG